jgi:hypothetical protein
MEMMTALENDDLTPLQPEAVMPSQLSGGPSRVPPFQPEEALLLAVLEDAIRTFEKYVTASGPRGRRRFAEVEAWFTSEEETASPFSFVNVCYALGLEESYVRNGLPGWRRSRLGRARRADSVGTFTRAA